MILLSRQITADNMREQCDEVAVITCHEFLSSRVDRYRTLEEYISSWEFNLAI